MLTGIIRICFNKNQLAMVFYQLAMVFYQLAMVLKQKRFNIAINCSELVKYCL